MSLSFCLKTSLSTPSIKNQENTDIKTSRTAIGSLKNILETTEEHSTLDKAQRTQRILCETTETFTTKRKGALKESDSKDEEVLKMVQLFTTFIFFCMHKRYMI